MTAARSESLVLPFTTARQLVGPLLAIIVGIFMVILDNTAVNVAIPVLVDEFHSSLDMVQWTITGYALAQAAVIPLSGWVTDRFGSKQIFILSLILFTLGSVLCAFATTAEQLIAYRVIQGLGGGFVTPIAFAMTYRMSPPEKAGSIIGLMGIPILLAPALGPIVSGYLVDYVKWEWIFLINVPIGILGLFMCIFLLPRLPKKSSSSLDVWGIILGPLAFASLSYGLSEGSSGWTSDRTLFGLAVGMVALIGFIFVELRKSEPLLELRVFRSPLFTRGIIIQWVLQFAMVGIIFTIPYFMQRLMGMSAFHAGMWTLPQALAAGLCMPIGGRLYDKIGARPLSVIGLTLVGVGAYVLSTIEPSDSAWSFLLPRAILGTGMGLCFLALNTHLIQSAPSNLVSRVTSLTSAAQQVISSFSIAGLTTLIVSRTNFYVDAGEKDSPNAMTHAFHDAYWALVGLAVFGLLLAVTLKRPKVEKSAQAGHVVVEAH